MALFTVRGSLYQEGTPLNNFGSIDLTVSAAGVTTEQVAPKSMVDDNGVIRQFLFWDTGRRVTGKRKVRWTFNAPTSWSTWHAVAYYGIPPTGTGGGGHTVTVDAHAIGEGAPIGTTPIDGPASSFVNGPGGTPLAWPAAGNDHAVDTQFGAATLHAKAQIQRNGAGPTMDFSSWQQLTWGGDDSDFFDESDTGVTSSSGVTGIVNATGPDFPVAQNGSAMLLASYVVPVVTFTPPGRHDFYPDLTKLLLEYLHEHGHLPPPDGVGDPSPEDLIRIAVLVESMDRAKPGAAAGPDPFRGLADAAKTMTPAQIKQVMTQTRATLKRGEAALKSLEAIQKNLGPR